MGAMWLLRRGWTRTQPRLFVWATILRNKKRKTMNNLITATGALDAVQNDVMEVETALSPTALQELIQDQTDAMLGAGAEGLRMFTEAIEKYRSIRAYRLEYSALVAGGSND